MVFFQPPAAAAPPVAMEVYRAVREHIRAVTAALLAAVAAAQTTTALIFMMVGMALSGQSALSGRETTVHSHLPEQQTNKE
jgi:hypothetical protein